MRKSRSAKDLSSAERHLAVGKQGSYRGIWYSRALTAIGDIHQMGNRVDRAIALFQEAAKHARDRYDLGYAKISLMFCHSMRKDREAMLSAAREVLATRGMMEEYRKTAREVIAKAGGAPSP